MICRLAWERALAATVLIHRCNIAATGNLPAKVVGLETARFLCQFHSSRLMLRSANANATTKERKGNLKAAISPANVTICLLFLVPSHLLIFVTISFRKKIFFFPRSARFCIAI